MNTPNTAQALERLELISREMRELRVNHGKHTSPTLVAWAARIDAELATLRTALAQPDVPLIESVVAVDAKGVLRKLEIEHASQTGNGLRVVVNDALASQPSGEALPVGEVSDGFSGAHRGVKLYGPSRDHPAPGTKLYTHPSADAPVVAVDEWLPIESAPRTGRDLILLLTPSKFPQVAYSNTWRTAGFSVECKPTHWHPIPSIAALAPKPEGGHG